MTDTKHPGDDYQVGYGRPPQEHMQKAGAPSKNPYGRKGKPENRAAIAKRKRPLGMDETILKAAGRRRRVRTADGEKTITAKELLAERVFIDGAKTATAAFKAIEAVRQAE